MPAGVYHLRVEQGATFGLAITYKDANGNPINLSGYTGRMHLRKKLKDVDTFLEITTANGRMVLGDSSGTITISVDAATTANLAAVEGVYDLELVSGQTVNRVLTGTFTVIPEVTR